MSETIVGPDGKARCRWCAAAPEFLGYHDSEWGFPVGDDRQLFEKLCLESFQSGLSWRTILAKRENFRAAFQGFDFDRMARFTQRDVDRLLQDAGIVRHRGKIEAAISNAKVYLELKQRMSLSAFLWDFVNGEPVQNRFARVDDIPAQTDVSQAMAKALKAQGFRFCGPTTVAAFLQSVGLANDHLVDCHRYETCNELANAFKAPQE